MCFCDEMHAFTKALPFDRTNRERNRDAVWRGGESSRRREGKETDMSQ